MAEAFSVDVARLADMVDRMAHHQHVLESMLDEVEVVVSNLHRTWDGAASEAHLRAHGQWRSGAATMSEALGQLQQAGRHAHESYTAAVEANRKIWD